MTKNKVYLSRNFPCSAAHLFEWLQKPELFIQWFGPPNMEKIRAKINPVKGGKFEVTYRKKDGSPFIIEGEFTEINAPYSLNFKMAYRNNIQSHSHVSITLIPGLGPSCELRLEQAFTVSPKTLAGKTQAWEAMFDLLVACQSLV